MLHFSSSHSRRSVNVSPSLSPVASKGCLHRNICPGKSGSLFSHWRWLTGIRNNQKVASPSVLFSQIPLLQNARSAQGTCLQTISRNLDARGNFRTEYVGQTLWKRNPSRTLWSCWMSAFRQRQEWQACSILRGSGDGSRTGDFTRPVHLLLGSSWRDEQLLFEPEWSWIDILRCWSMLKPRFAEYKHHNLHNYFTIPATCFIRLFPEPTDLICQHVQAQHRKGHLLNLSSLMHCMCTGVTGNEQAISHLDWNSK